MIRIRSIMNLKTNVQRNGINLRRSNRIGSKIILKNQQCISAVKMNVSLLSSTSAVSNTVFSSNNILRNNTTSGNVLIERYLFYLTLNFAFLAKMTMTQYKNEEDLIKSSFWNTN